MYNFNFLKSDIKSHIEKNKAIYLMLLFCFFVGIILGLVVSISKTSFLGLLNVKDKTFINLINGTSSPVALFWKSLIEFVLPLIIVFLFSLNFYLNCFNFLFLIYQSMLLFLTSMAVIQSYSFVGFIKVFLILLPLNLLYFIVLIFWIAVCTNRAKLAKKRKMIMYGFNYCFITKIYICAGAVLLLSLIVGFVLPIILKTAIFIVY